ncbi:MAG: hypothetical protein HQL41_04890 [Alphaproteobacteria bacterium]|nr:hypothetical protein [Alphaproteobacteria bacterium]
MSILAFERVLGVPPMQRTVEFYSEQGGIFFATLAQMLLAGWSGLSDGIEFLAAWRASWVWLATFFSVAGMLIALRTKGKVAAIHLVAIEHVGIAGLLGAFALLYIQAELLTVRNTLMLTNQRPVVESVAAAMLDDQKAGGHLERDKHLSRLAHFIDRAGGGEGFERLFQFDKADGHGNLRVAVFVTIVFMAFGSAMVVGAVCLAIGQPSNRMQRAVLALSVLFAAVEAFFLPYTHGVLGRLYHFPVGSIRYVTDAGRSSHSIVFMLARDDKSYIFYDRENFFQIIHAERSQTRGFDQVGLESPFSNCSGSREFRGCESRWGLQSQ